MFMNKNKKANSFDDDPFNRFMFGTRKRMNEPVKEDNIVGSLLEKVDIEELMDNIDFFMTSAKQLKPIVKKISPLVQQFIKKD